MLIYKYTFVHNGDIIKRSHQDKRALMADVIAYMRKNNINFNESDISRSIDRQSAVTNTGKKHKVTFADAIHGVTAMIKYASRPGSSNQEIVRRSDICATCPQRSDIAKCGPCGTMRKITTWVNSIRAKKKVEAPIPSEVKYSYCGICDCSLALMVVTKIEDFYEENSSKNALRPTRCWLKNTSPNYIKD